MASKAYTVCEGVLWRDIVAPTSSEMEELAGEFGLNPYIVRDCMEPDHLPKYDLVDGVHFLIVRFFSHVFDKRIATTQDLTNKIALFYTDDYLITIHREEIHFLDHVRRKYVETERCTSPTEVITRILWHTLESFADPVQRLSEQVDFYENHIILRGIRNEQIEGLYYIKQQASICNKIIMLMLEPINHVHTTPTNDVALQDVRDQHLKVQTLYQQVLEDVNNLTNLYMSLSAQKTSEVMKVLTVFSVFFMPLTFIAGIYGMNFHHMPELAKPWGYPAALLLMLGVAIGIYLWFRKRRWM